MGKRPILSVYSFIFGSSQIYSSEKGRTGSGVGGERVPTGAEGVVCVLVEHTP